MLHSTMPLYFMLHDAARFHERIRPALSASWRQRSLEPCRELCASLVPAVAAFAERYHTGPEEPLLCRAARGLAFDRAYWRLLVSEVLLYGADELPEFQTAPDTLCRLLAREHCLDDLSPREGWPPIRQAHFGARDLVFGGYYRPEHAGWNDGTDVACLAAYLASCRPDVWTAAELRVETTLSDDEIAEELAFARECLRALQVMYAGAAAKGQVVVCEVL